MSRRSRLEQYHRSSPAVYPPSPPVSKPAITLLWYSTPLEASLMHARGTTGGGVADIAKGLRASPPAYCYGTVVVRVAVAAAHAVGRARPFIRPAQSRTEPRRSDGAWRALPVGFGFRLSRWAWALSADFGLHPQAYPLRRNTPPADIRQRSAQYNDDGKGEE
ncbi:hypothetical protein B0H14DRAFT_2576151 [Mycena olivaceomarginata]|nr:hypothetical protein B0H14DRAFT_2576151 [Mycena olivaceomarginata]